MNLPPTGKKPPLLRSPGRPRACWYVPSFRCRVPPFLLSIFWDFFEFFSISPSAGAGAVCALFFRFKHFPLGGQRTCSSLPFRAALGFSLPFWAFWNLPAWFGRQLFSSWKKNPLPGGGLLFFCGTPFDCSWKIVFLLPWVPLSGGASGGSFFGL